MSVADEKEAAWCYCMLGSEISINAQQIHERRTTKYGVVFTHIQLQSLELLLPARSSSVCAFLSSRKAPGIGKLGRGGVSQTGLSTSIRDRDTHCINDIRRSPLCSRLAHGEQPQERHRNEIPKVSSLHSSPRYRHILGCTRCRPRHKASEYADFSPLLRCMAPNDALLSHQSPPPWIFGFCRLRNGYEVLTLN